LLNGIKKQGNIARREKGNPRVWEIGSRVRRETKRLESVDGKAKERRTARGRLVCLLASSEEEHEEEEEEEEAEEKPVPRESWTLISPPLVS